VIRLAVTLVVMALETIEMVCSLVFEICCFNNLRWIAGTIYIYRYLPTLCLHCSHDAKVNLTNTPRPH
jgi:hypothetical protein